MKWKALPILLFLAAAPRVSHACSCRSSTLEERFERASVVFVGTVIFTKPAFFSRSKQHAFIVHETLKGEVGNTVLVSTAQNGAACGSTFRLGKKYKVFASNASGNFHTWSCSGNQVVPN